MKANKRLLVFSIAYCCYLIFISRVAAAQDSSQVLTIKEALNITLTQHELIKAKANYASASAQYITTTKREGQPDLILSAQQGYGTINGLNGLPSGLPGLISMTSGPVTPAQNWNAAFASSYASEINWNIFSFGLQRAHVADARGQYTRDAADLNQEKFQQQVKAAGAYLNLLGAQRIHYSLNINLLRVMQLRKAILVRTQNGLNPGVDSSIANAELSKARIAVTDAINYEQSQAAGLAMQLGVSGQNFILDSIYVKQLPLRLPLTAVSEVVHNPELLYLSAKLTSNELSTNYLAKTNKPKISLFGAFQGRGSGFGTDYTASSANVNQSYWNGADPIRENYLVGVGITWNLSELGRVSSRVKSARYQSSGLNDEYLYQKNNLTNQLKQGDYQLVNALQKYHEAPVQLKAATDAYDQKKTLYDNGLATIVEVTQTLYDLNRAETDKDIASNGVWQALLYIAGSSGNLDLFINQF